MTKANITAWCNEHFQKALNAIKPNNSASSARSNNNSNKNSNNPQQTSSNNNISNGYTEPFNQNNNNNKRRKDKTDVDCAASINSNGTFNSDSSISQENISTTEQSSSVHQMSHELITIKPNFLQSLPQAVLSELPSSPRTNTSQTTVNHTYSTNLPTNNKLTNDQLATGQLATDQLAADQQTDQTLPISSTINFSESTLRTPSEDVRPKYSTSVENQLDHSQNQTAKKKSHSHTP